MTNADFTARCMAGKALDDIAGKQDVIADLDTIRSGAAAGATAVQPATMEIALTAKQDTLTAEQLAAVNSGITVTDVEQIETNKNNILSLNQTSQYNMAGMYDSGTGRATFAALYKLAIDSLGLDTSVLHHYIVHVYTNTVSPTADLLIMYGTYYHNNSISHAVLYNSQLSYYADNTQGTLVVSGGDNTIHASVRFLD